MLDLGPALGASVEFLAGYSVQLFIADLFRSLCSSTGQLPADAAAIADIVILAVPGMVSEAVAQGLGDLGGKIVLLDFWTYGCINCIHVIPDLKRLEQEYPEELVVIGVHSAKFSNEAETENIRQVVMRYEVDHPVVNDNEFTVWQNWGAQAWPTFALIDPAGNEVGLVETPRT